MRTVTGLRVGGGLVSGAVCSSSRAEALASRQMVSLNSGVVVRVTAPWFPRISGTSFFLKATRKVTF